jgi:Ca2+:H+ antiporter
MGYFSRRELAVLAAAVLGTGLTFLLRLIGAGDVLVFIVAGLALAALAAAVGDAVEQLGSRVGPGATGVLQSALGNLPELFVAIFALRAGLVAVVQSALVGSILANNLLVLGLAFVVGGLRHGTQRFQTEPPRVIVVLLTLAVGALIVPTLAHTIHTPAEAHAGTLSVAVAILLLAVFVLSVPASLRSAPAETAQAPADATHAPAVADPEEPPAASWPLWLAAVVLAVTSVAAAVVSDWFVNALKPATQALHLSEAFTGLVIVAIASNAVENVVGVQLAARNKADYAVSVILNSPLQIALALTPVLVLLSYLLGSTAHLTLVLPPLLVVVLALATVLPTLIVFDGESSWLEGAVLIGLYGVIATAFWWG